MQVTSNTATTNSESSSSLPIIKNNEQEFRSLEVDTEAGVESSKEMESTESMEIPLSWRKIIEKQQKMLVIKIANHYSLDINEIMKEIMPNLAKTTKSKKSKKKKREKLSDYTQATKKEELKDFKIPDLKEILQSNNLPVSGNKAKLIDRVWGILKPDEAVVEVKKKRGRKSKKDKSLPVEIDSGLIEKGGETGETEEEGEENNQVCELDIDTMPTIYIDSDGNISKSGTLLKIFKDKFVFKEDDDENIEFMGIKNNDKVEFMDDHPQELLDLLGM